MTFPRNSLRVFLAYAKKGLFTAIQSSQKITIVAGNESADLDSLTSSILYSYIRSLAPPATAFSQLYVPLLNIHAADVHLRPEFQAVFRHAYIDASHLVTLDDLPEGNGHDLKLENTRFILVDHNNLQGELGKKYAAFVHGVVDHHEDKRSVIPDTDPEPRVIEKCGSCTSLVVRSLKESWESSANAFSLVFGGAHAQGDSTTNDARITRTWDAQIAKMALASILIDTANLTAEGKVEEADIEAVKYLEAIIKLSPQDAEQWDRKEFYEEIDTAKRDIDGLSLEDILRKDYKQWTENSLRLGIASVVKPLEFIVTKAIAKPSEDKEDQFVTAIGDFMAARDLTIFAIMTTSISPLGQFQRELYVQALSAGYTAASTFAEQANAELQLADHSVSILSTRPGSMQPSSEGPCWTNFSGRPLDPASSNLPLAAVPHITIIRPVRGIEPRLYECLAATFQQNYPISKLTIFLCIASRDDPAFPILERLLYDFPTFDAQILVEEEDPNLSGRSGNAHNLGPNPKIRNMSRGYREAKGDVMWIIDCNVWVDQSVAGRMVDLLCGFAINGQGRKYKFVHQLPLAVDISDALDANSQSEAPAAGDVINRPLVQDSNSIFTYLGGRLEEMFLSTSHAKFYTAISAVAVAPCIVGKSNMFRRSHLNALTKSDSYRDPGIDYFSENICEDHLIGDLLWKSPVPEKVQFAAGSEGQIPGSIATDQARQVKWSNHGLLTHSLAVQPTCNFPLGAYLARRTRWLRVRKFTVALATFVEHGTECLFCSAYGAFGITTLPWCNETLGIPRTWTAFFVLWLFSVMMWCAVDSHVWQLLQNSGTSDAHGFVTSWARRKRKVKWTEWLLAWIGREVFAFPIWLWAVVGGVTVVWRGRRFWVGMDMKVHEIDAKGTETNEDMGIVSNSESRNNGPNLRGDSALPVKGRLD
ncbi:MAG: hypothetical protein Q9209_005721 [Squamulea sp. 1 TL-2023]